MMQWMRSPDEPHMISGLIDLCEYLKPHQTGIMYEIGSFAGESAEIFAHYFSVVHCVDPWFPPAVPSTVEDSFDERAAAAGNIIKHKCRSLDAAPSVGDESLDFVYIDAEHYYDDVLSDLHAWYPKVKPGAFLGAHDCDAQQVIKAIGDFFGREADAAFADHSWIFRKF